MPNPKPPQGPSPDEIHTQAIELVHGVRGIDAIRQSVHNSERASLTSSVFSLECNQPENRIDFLVWDEETDADRRYYAYTATPFTEEVDAILSEHGLTTMSDLGQKVEVTTQKNTSTPITLLEIGDGIVAEIPYWNFMQADETEDIPYHIGRVIGRYQKVFSEQCGAGLDIEDLSQFAYNKSGDREVILLPPYDSLVTDKGEFDDLALKTEQAITVAVGGYEPVLQAMLQGYWESLSDA